MASLSCIRPSSSSSIFDVTLLVGDEVSCPSCVMAVVLVSLPSAVSLVLIVSGLSVSENNCLPDIGRFGKALRQL